MPLGRNWKDAPVETCVCKISSGGKIAADEHAGESTVPSEDHINLKIMSKQKNRTTNPTQYGKPKRSPAEKCIRSVALGRSLVIRMCPEWEKVQRATTIITILRWTCAQAVSMYSNRITVKTTDGKTHVLVADSTGITTTGKGRWIELKWNVKCNFIKLHILADEKSQKILAFRITDTGRGDTKNLPSMLDCALERLGVPLEDRSIEPAVAIQVNDIPADENSIETITEYMCDCSCCQTISREWRVSRVGKPPVAIIRGDGWYDSREAFSHYRKRGV